MNISRFKFLIKFSEIYVWNFYLEDWETRIKSIGIGKAIDKIFNVRWYTC
jgi:hypothetical protein